MTREFTSAEREQQRVTYLVLERPRPRRVPQKGRRAKPKPIQLAPGVEERVALREEWRGIEGTPETLEHASQERRREGSLARLARTGAIDAHQLAAADEIRTAHDEVTADVKVRTAKLEPRSSAGRSADEKVGQMLRAVAYTRWRSAAGTAAPMLLAIIIDDMGLVEAARRWRMSDRRARATLIGALDRWRRT